MDAREITLVVEFPYAVSPEMWEMLVEQLVTLGETTGAEVVAKIEAFNDISERGDEDG